MNQPAPGSRLRLWMLVTCVVATQALSGCVFNPYVTQRQIRPRTDCSPATDDTKLRRDAPEAIRNAECVRQQMERHVSHNAYVNSIGGVTLIGLASFATFQGMRGNNEANVSALSVGGAGMYGAMQWLYKKPREAIYLSGSSALACAIDEATEVFRKDTELTALDAQARAATASRDTLAQLVAGGNTEARQMSSFLDTCKWHDKDNGLRTQFEAAYGQLLENPGSATLARFDTLQARHVGLIAAQGEMARQLNGVTEGIRETVNRQLAAQQPDPSELAGLLSGLKLRALSGATAAPKPAPAPGTQVAFDGGGAKPRHCNAPQAQWHVTNARNALAQIAASERKLDAQLDSYEAGLPAADGEAMRLVDRCPLVRFGAPQPLSVVFTAGSSVAKGKSLEVALVGGEVPHRVHLVSERPTGEQPAFKHVTGEKDTSRLTVSPSDKTAADRFTFVVNDRLGASQTFQVDVTD